MKKDVKCYIVNNDVSVFEYEILEGVKTFQIEMIGRSNKRYIIANKSTMQEAKNYIKYVLGLDFKKSKK